MDENKEMLNTLKGMLKSNDLNDTQLAISIINNQEGLIEDAIKNKVWYNIKDYITANTIKYWELYCHEDNHDKVYIIVVNRIMGKNKNEVEIIAYYGRRGTKKLRSDRKGYSTPYYSEYTVKNLINEKVNTKGYTLINEITL